MKTYKRACLDSQRTLAHFKAFDRCNPNREFEKLSTRKRTVVFDMDETLLRAAIRADDIETGEFDY